MEREVGKAHRVKDSGRAAGSTLQGCNNRAGVRG